MPSDRSVMSQPASPDSDFPTRNWWEGRRLHYNVALIIAMILGYMAFGGVLDAFEHIICAPIIIKDSGRLHSYDCDMGGIASLFHCAGACSGLLLANACYLLGPFCELFVPDEWIDSYRKWAWRAGLAFSCFLPFTIALFHLMMCLLYPSWFNPTPRYM